MSNVTPKNNSWLMGAFLSSDLDDAGLDPYEFRVYLHFCRRVGDELRCWDSHATIAKICKISERKVREALVLLADKGMISIEKRYREDGSQTSNSYYVHGLIGLEKRGGVAHSAGGGGTERQGGVAHSADEGIPLSVRNSNLRTTISTTPSYTTTQDAPKKLADETTTQDAPRGGEEKLLERGEGGSHLQHPTPTVRTASRGHQEAREFAQAHNTRYMSPATSRKTNTTSGRSSEAPSDSQTTPTSPVQPTNTVAEQILQAYHQTRFNKPCSDPQQVVTLMAYATDLHNAGYSPAQVTKATRNAMERWSQPEHATLRAVAKHIATLLQPVESNSVRQSDKPAYEAPIVTRDKSYKRTSECESMNLALELQETLDALRLTATQKKYKR